ncbi:MAG TPA: hypothetical protein VFJ58_13395 [Armatimonadota bacterium]|nr:hypothetical protein [Armatimonadota bacterium]
MKHNDYSDLTATVYQEAALPLSPQLLNVSVAMPASGYSSLVTGTLQTAGAVLPAGSPVTLDPSASGTNDAYKGLAIRITGGAGSGGRGTILSYVGSTKIAMVAWGTGSAGSAGVPAALDDTSVYDLSVDCYNRGKVIVKVEYSNSSCAAGLRLVLRDPNGKAVVAAKQTPINLGITDHATVGYLAESFEVATDGMDTAFLIVDTAASGGSSPGVTAWAAAV